MKRAVGMRAAARFLTTQTTPMQRYITTDELARQCNIDNITDGETQYLSDLLEASAETVENKIQQSISDVSADNDGEIPAPLKQAILLIAANLYANREPVAYGVPQRIPYTLDYLIEPYVKYV